MKLTWEARTYEILVGENGTMGKAPVEGMVAGNFGLHILGHGSAYVSLTHIPSGKRVGEPIESLGKAVRAARAVVDVVGYFPTEEEVVKEAARIREALGAVE